MRRFLRHLDEALGVAAVPVQVAERE